ncbi:MAG: hypothetical protein E7419_02475 [Ruminococcaceae bacterium]|nr:hypothetical protein [Oscillospiraceae bacterium]
MAKKLTSICLALSMLMMLGLTGMAYTLPADANAVIVTRNGNVYTVEVSNPVYANADVTLVAVANGNDIPESMAVDSVAYFNEKTADENGDVTFTFEPKDGFNNDNGLYVAVSTKRGVDTVIARAEYSVSVNSEHGAVSVYESVKEGDTLYFSVKADYGYEVANVKVNGNVVEEYIVEKVKDDIEISVEYEVVAAAIGNATVFNTDIIPSEFLTQYGEDMTEDALNAKYAAVIFSKVSSLTYEYGIVYSKTNADPTADGADCKVLKAKKVGSQGAFGMYLFSDVENTDTYNVRSYVKSGNEYTYGDVTTFTLRAVDTGAAE